MKTIFFAILIFLSIVLVCIPLKEGTSQQNNIVDSQPEPMDILCGPRALLTFCTMYGVDASLEELAKLSKVNEHGTNMLNLLEAAQSKGLSAVGRILKYDELMSLNKPVIAFINNNHFSILEAIDKDIARLSNNFADPIVLSREEISEIWRGYCLVVSKPRVSNKNSVPNIVFETTVHDFGMMPQGAFVDYDFVLKNTGSVPLKITHVTGSCDCIITAPTRSILQANDTAEIGVRLDLDSNDIGRINRTFVVSSNDPYCKAFPLTLTGVVVEGLEVIPKSIFLRRIGTEDVIRRTIRLKAPPNRLLEFTRISASDGIKIHQFPGTGQESSILEAIIGPNLPIGSISKSIEVELKNIYTDRTHDAPPIKISIPVEGIVESELSVFPERLFFGFVSSAKGKTGAVELKNGKEPPLVIARVENQHPSVNVSVESIKPGYKYTVRARIEPEAPQGEIKDTLRLYTVQQGSEYIVEIPLFGIIR